MKLLYFLTIFFILNLVISCGDENNTEKEKEINKCSGVDCPDNSICKVINEKAECKCNDGYDLSPDELQCVKNDIDLCENIQCNSDEKCILGDCIKQETEKIKLRLLAANITSGNDQAYEEEGIRIFKALKADIIMIQEFNSKTGIDSFVKNTFGAEYTYFRGNPRGNGDIPDGIISKYPIIKSGEIDDPRVTDREIDWVEIKVSDKVKLMVFSVHLKGQEDNSQITAAQIITKEISEHKKLNTGYYYIVGGDFNGEASVSNEGFGKYNGEDIFVINSAFPKSEYGDDGNTNKSRTARLDYVLVDNELYKYQISTDYCISEGSCKKYKDGLVFDSRNYSNSDLSVYFSPVESSDCDVKNMQHLAVVKDFLIGKKEILKKEVLTKEEFNSIFKNPIAEGKSTACPGYDFYNYEEFINATHEYPKFGNEGSEEIKKREIAAFLANISHETTGGWANAPGGATGRYLWGLCWKEEIGCEDGSCTQYCQSSNTQYPCKNNKTYHGRGPIQLTWNYNYGAVGEKIGVDLLSNPELVSGNASISFRTALWFWMTPQSPKPSSHDVMVENWIPNTDDLSKNRKIGFGMTVNIINGGRECGKTNDSRVIDRVEHYKYFCDLLSTTTGDNLYCDEMEHY